MSVKPTLGVAGLWISTNPHVTAPRGALITADEVVLRRPGTVEQRPGFKIGAEFEDLVDVRRLVPFDGTYFAVGSPGGGDPVMTFWADDTLITTDDGADLSWLRSAIRGCEARQNLYLTTRDGVRRLMSSDDTEALMAGLIPPTVISAATDGAGDVVADGMAVAYRATVELVLPNGLVIVSAPSGRAVYKNNTGNSQNAAPRITVRSLPAITGCKKYLKIWRTLQSTQDTPPDDMFLARQVDISAFTELSTGAYPDDTLDVELGEPLYTNSRREGIERQNIRPPAAQDLALYQGSLIAANITRQARARLRWTEGGDLSGETNGVGFRTYTGTRTHNSAVITGLSSVDGLEKGMLLSSATNWAGTGPVRVVAVLSSSSVSVSEVFNGSTDGAPVSITFCDSIVVAPTTGTAMYYRADSLRAFLEGFNDGLGVSSGRIEQCPDAFAVATSEASRVENTTFISRTRTVLIEAISAFPTIEFRATHGDEYDPPVPDFEDDDPLAVAPEHLQNAVMWSKGEEPEHFMLGALRYVGHQSSPILRAVATRDAVWLLKGKGDGVYRFSGFGELNGFRADKFDSTTYLLHAELAAAMDDKAYAWTNRGAAEISDAGVKILNAPIKDLSTAIELGVDHEDTLAGALCVANLKDGEVIWGLTEYPLPDSDSGAVDGLLVYNTRTDAWSRWFRNVGTSDQVSCAAYDLETRQIVFGKALFPQVRVERVSEGFAVEVFNADREHTGVEILSVVEDLVVITGAAEWSPQIGDVLRLGDFFAVITDVESEEIFTVHDASGLEAAEGAIGYEAYSANVAWLPKVGEGPAVLKRHQEVLTHWERFFGIQSLYVSLASSRDFTGSVLTPYEFTYSRPADDRPKDHRAGIPRSHVAATRLYPRVIIRQADARWRISGITINSEPLSTRVHR